MRFLDDFDALGSHLAKAGPRTDLVASAAGAATAAILRRDGRGAPELLFIRRAEHPDDPWSGHMALPGGRRDPEDSSLVDTAIREAREEVGIDLATTGRLVLQLPDVGTPARARPQRVVVAPFVFVLEQDAEASGNHEVAELVWAPLGPLARGECRSTFSFEYRGQALELPCHRIGERVVWGLTFQMLEALFEVLGRAS